ncbi:hypothetical protein [Brevibacterium litoralis]|uniref:hypothetical protein n=1 Tax=Brevibacterium litoralis TaxID=3138935 RepID=UPI0032F01507
MNVDEHPTPRDWFDVALLVNDARAEVRTWGERVQGAWIRFAVLFGLAVVLGLKDTPWLPNHILFVILWPVLAFFAAFPYGVVGGLVRSRGGAMTSTIRISGAGHG